jgi:GGDEF domain-containing protein
VVATSLHTSLNTSLRQTRTPELQDPASWLRPAGFDRVAGDVLAHLLRTSPMACWLVVRFGGADSQDLRIMKSVGETPLAPEMGITRADLSGTLAGQLVRLRASSRLSQQIGVRSCVAAVIGDESTGTSVPFGAIVGLDSSVDVVIPGGFGEQLRLHASHLESALRDHQLSFAAEHNHITDRDLVNGFDTAFAWTDRLHLLDRHCTAVGDDASVAVIDIDGLGVLKQQFGYLAADELLREISFMLRSLSLPNAHFARLTEDRIVVARVGSDHARGFDAEYWANDLRTALRLAIESSPLATASAVRCRVGVASRIWGQRRGLEQAQNRAAKDAILIDPKR